MQRHRPDLLALESKHSVERASSAVQADVSEGAGSRDDLALCNPGLCGRQAMADKVGR